MQMTKREATPPQQAPIITPTEAPDEEDDNATHAELTRTYPA